MIVEKSGLPNIFNEHRNIEVPFFQRAYVWEEDQCARLLNDIEDVCKSKLPYFLGTLIFRAKPPSTNGNQAFIVIDGQQRLTAISLLCKALSLKTSNANERTKIENRFKDYDGKLALLHCDSDRAVYNQIMELKESPKGGIKGDSSLAASYNYFDEYVDPKKVDFKSICDYLEFVSIQVTEKEDEQQIFDSINSLGVRLTAAELLKNYFFRRGGEDRENYEKYWKSVFERDSDTQKYWDAEFVTTRKRESMIDPFFFSYLQIRVQGDTHVEPKDKDKFSKAGRLFESYKNYIDVYLEGDRNPILEDINGYAEVFRNAIDEEMLKSPTPQRGIERLNMVIFGLRVTTLLPYILFVEKNVAEKEERNKIYDCLEAFIVSRLLTGKETRGYDTLFGTTLIAKKISSSEKLKKFLSTEAVGGNAIPTYAEIQLAFHERTNISNPSATVILYLIESKLRENDSTALHPLKVYSLEHMMPKKWTKHWPAPDDPVLRNKKLRTLGNLTIVTGGHNREMSNKSWEKKRISMKERSEGIRTLFGALEKEQWDERAIDERAEKLAEALADMYEIDRTSTPEKA